MIFCVYYLDKKNVTCHLLYYPDSYYKLSLHNTVHTAKSTAELEISCCVIMTTSEFNGVSREILRHDKHDLQALKYV